VREERIANRSETAQIYNALPADATEAEQLIHVLDLIEQSGVDITEDYHVWINCGLVIAPILGWDGAKYFHRLSARYEYYYPQQTRDVYHNIMVNARGDIGIGSLVYYARQMGAIA